MMSVIKVNHLIFLLLFAWCSIVQAGVRHYQAAIDESKWIVAKHHPLLCQMSHTIPLYGQAIFMQKAGEKPDFHLQVLRPPTKKSFAKLLSMPPAWVAQKPSKSLARVDVRPKRIAFAFHSEHARLMLAELEAGWFPTLEHPHWDDEADQVVAGLSAVNFRPALDDYLKCLNQLLPYGYKDVRSTTLYYGPGKVHPDQRENVLLKRIARFLEVDPSVRQVVISGYTDSIGTRRDNYLVSIKRLRVVEQFFVEQGFDKEKIDATAYGERHAVASNKTARGRALNRRVTIRLVR